MDAGKNVPKKLPQAPPKKVPVPTPPVTAKPKSNLLYYLIVLCCFGNFLPYIVTTSVNCGNARQVLRREVFNHLISVRDIKKDELEAFFNERRGDAMHICNNPLFKWTAISYQEAFKRGGLEGKDYEEVDSRYGRVFPSYASACGYYDIMIIDMAGNVVCTTKKRPELGKNILAAPYADTPLAEAFKRGQSSLFLGDIKWYEPYQGPAQFLSAPIKKEVEGEPVAVLVLHMDGVKIDEMMIKRPGLKESGETYLVGQDMLARSDSRFTSGSDVLKMKVNTVASREALAGNTNVKIIEDYRDVKVVSAYTPIEVSSGIRWALIAEIDKAEALHLEDKLFNQVVYMTFAMFPIWGGIIFAFYRIIRRDQEAFYSGKFTPS
jgi:methyl-accepting chemotaxis protein